MTDRETLYRGASHAAWGYFFLYLDINLGALNILPDWAAYLLFLSAIGKLQGERRDLALLRPLGILLALWNGADWGLALFGGSFTDRLPPVDLVISVVQLYFHFQFLTDCAGLAAAYQPPGEGVDVRLLRWRTLQTVLLTAAVCLTYLPLDWEGAGAVALTLLAVVCVIAGLCIMAALFALRRLFREDAPPQETVS